MLARSGGCELAVGWQGRRVQLKRTHTARTSAAATATDAAAAATAAAASPTVQQRAHLRELPLATHELPIARRHAPHASQPAHPAAAELLGVAPLVEARVRALLAQHRVDLTVPRAVQPRPSAHRCVVEPEL